MDTIRKSLSSGVFYIALSKYSSIFFQILIGAILARLLTPEEFGIVALVTVFVSFFNLLSDFGIGPAVVQNQSLTDNDVKSIFSFSILCGFLFAGLFFLAAPLIAGFYNKPELVKVSRLLSLSVLFYSLQIVPKALFQKALKFKQIGIIGVSVQLFSSIVAIVLAYAGFSYYAIVIQNILAGGISLIVFYLVSHVSVAFKIEMGSIKKIIRFSSFQFMFNFINYFSRNADNILIGKFFGSAALGFYDKSYRLMMMPVEQLTHVITPVLMPVLSKYQDDKEFVYNTYLKIIKILATIGFPLSVFLFFSANEIIHILYGPQWGQSVPVFKLLAITIGFQMILSSSGAIFQTINRTDLMFISGLLGAIVLVSGISYGIFIGKSIIAVGYGIVFGYFIYFALIFYLLIKIALKKRISRFYKVLQFPFITGIEVAIVLWQFEKICPKQYVYSFLTKTLVAGLTFGIIFLSLNKNRILLKQGLKKYLRK